MKNLAIILVAVAVVVVVMAAPAHAVLLFEETFDGTVGANVETTGNWVETSGETMTITDVVIDDGNSADGDPGGAWTNHVNSTLINHTLAANEPGFRYTWTNADHDGDGIYAALYGRPTGSGQVWYVQYQPSGLDFNGPGGALIYEEPIQANSKFRVETSVAGGTSLWVNGVHKFTDPSFGFDHVDHIAITNEGMYWDSIKLEIIPEPSTMGLLAIGGMLTMLRRRR